MSSLGVVTAAEDVLFEDFEGADYGGWVASGTAFSTAPVSISNSVLVSSSLAGWDNQIIDSLSSSPDGRLDQGSLTSPSFVVTHNYIHFLIAGAEMLSRATMVLVDSDTDEQLEIITGDKNNRFTSKKWDVSSHLGRNVKIVIQDTSVSNWSHLLVDRIVFSDNPTSSISGVFSADVWNDIDNAFDVSGLVMDDAFFESPDVESISTSSFFDIAQYAGGRLRGYITAPETGNYTFWISASTSGELWLSSDETKYRKQLLASFGGDTGTGSRGVAYGDGNLWDMYSAQMSEEVYLEAGQQYFIEMFTQQNHVGNGDRHLSVAWARPGQDRELIPSAYLTSYALESEDADDDYLPDAWETQYGLDPLDNGLVDRPHQGERGDFDFDGLSNREEFVLGTDPSNADTDGDGLSDADEVRSYSTDPTQSDAPSETLVSDLDLSSYSSNGITWTMTSQGLIPSSFRGDISWDFTVPSDGYWSINAATTLLGDLYLQENVDFEISIDGVLIEKKNLVYGQDRDAILRILTPYLTAGTHTLGIHVDNMAARRMVTFTSIQVLQPQGADLDGDGIPDWINSELTGQNRLLPYQPLSRTSPAFLEGYASLLSGVQVNGAAVIKGVDENHWYANIDLNPTQATAFTAVFNQSVSEPGNLQWLATNVLENETLIIRRGDALKLTAALPDPAVVGTSTLDIDSADVVGFVSEQLALSSATDYHVYQFSDAGTYTVDAAFTDSSNGSVSTGQLTVIVKQAEFSPVAQDLLSNTIGTLNFSPDAVTSDLYFEGGNAVFIKPDYTVTATNIALQAQPQKHGSYHLIARLHQDGPILNTQPLNIMAFADVLQTAQESTFFSRDFVGYMVITSPIVATGLPVGGTVVVTIHRSGVTFPDGTKTQTLSAADFVNDVYYLDFLFPIGLSGGYCHYVDIYDSNGAFIARR